VRTRALVVMGVVVAVGLAAGAAYLGHMVAGRLQHHARMEAPPQKGQPLPSGPEARTSREMSDLNERFNTRNLTEAYSQHGMRDPRWDAAATTYLARVVLYFRGRPDAPARADLLAEGVALEQAGCRDPAVLYCRGAVAQDGGDAPEAKRLLLRAAAGYERTTYPAIRRRYVATRLARLYRQPRNSHEAALESWRKRALQWTDEALRDGSYQPGESRLVLEHLSQNWDACFEAHQDELLKILQGVSGLDPWIADCVAGWIHIDKAWDARGSGWASEVTPEGWKGFSEHLQQAREALTRAWKAHPDRPEPASSMIKVVMGGGGARGETERLWFDRAVKAQFDFLPAYQGYAYAMLPRWGGSSEIQYAFGRECAQTRRYDTDVPLQLYQVLRKMDWDVKGVSPAWRKPETFPLLQEMFEGYIAVTTNLTRRANRSLLAASAWRCGRMEEAYRYLRELGDDLDAALIEKDFDTPVSRIRAEAAAGGGPLAAEIAALEARRVREPSAVLAGYDELLQRAEADEWTRSYLRGCRATLQFATDWEKGEPITLAVPADLAGWTVRSGTWRVEQDGALRGVSTDDGLMLVCDALLEGGFEMSGDLEWAHSPHGWKYNGGLLFGFGDDAPASFASVLLYRKEAVATLRKGFRFEREVGGPAVAVQTTNHFRVSIWRGRVTADINGVEVFRRQEAKGFDAPAAAGSGWAATTGTTMPN
jgi:hypothetical protein